MAEQRLLSERKAWRKDHPPDMVAKPSTKSDGSTNVFKWDCRIPGKKGTDWEGGENPIILEFSEDYPTKGPKVKFAKPVFHPNVYADGKICLSITNEGTWKAAVTIKQILIGVQVGHAGRQARRQADRCSRIEGRVDYRAAPPVFYPCFLRLSLLHIPSILFRHPADTARSSIRQDLLETPNNGDAAQREAHDVYKRSKSEYSKRIRAQAKQFAPKN